MRINLRNKRVQNIINLLKGKQNLDIIQLAPAGANLITGGFSNPSMDLRRIVDVVAKSVFYEKAT